MSLDSDLDAILNSSQPSEFSFGRVGKNAWPSAKNYVRDLVSALSNPKETLRGMQDTASGYAQRFATDDRVISCCGQALC